MLIRALAIGSAVAVTILGGAARADGYPPFYGYSEYFGGPTTYFTPEDTVGQVTTLNDPNYGLGKRTYYRGGPFWAYQPNQRRPRYVREAPRRRRVVLRRRS